MMRPARAPPILPAWTHATGQPDHERGQVEVTSGTIGVSGSIMASAETSSRSGSCTATAWGVVRGAAREGRRRAVRRRRRSTRPESISGQAQPVAELDGIRLADACVAQDGSGGADDRGASRYRRACRRRSDERTRARCRRRRTNGRAASGLLTQNRPMPAPTKAVPTTIQVVDDAASSTACRIGDPTEATSRFGRAHRPADDARGQGGQGHRDGDRGEQLAGQRGGQVHRGDVQRDGHGQHAEGRPGQRRDRVEAAIRACSSSGPVTQGSDACSGVEAAGNGSSRTRCSGTRDRGPPRAIAATTMPPASRIGTATPQ